MSGSNKPEPVGLSRVLREEARERKLKQIGADFFLADLSGKILVVKYYDDVDGIIFAEVDGKEVKIIAQGQVAKRKLRAIKEYIMKHKVPVRVKVVLRYSKKTGNRYVDLLDPNEEEREQERNIVEDTEVME